jgi:hypothetical protein
VGPRAVLDAVVKRKISSPGTTLSSCAQNNDVKVSEETGCVTDGQGSIPGMNDRFVSSPPCPKLFHHPSSFLSVFTED